MSRNPIKFFFAKEGLPFVLISWAALFFAMVLEWTYLYIPLFFCALLISWFFRDPERAFKGDPNYILAPADGKIVEVEVLKDPLDSEGRPMHRISIFMSIFDVHVNRAPFSGTVEEVRYLEGRFFSANLEKSSLENERNWVIIRTHTGERIYLTQIAGIIARRISCWVKKGELVKRGQRIGLIRFGSRVDIYLPQKVKLLAGKGKRTKAGKSILAYWDEEG